MEKVTFITTVYNEEKTINSFLESIFDQSKLPDEIVIVDAFSSDRTAQKITTFFKKHSRKSHVKFLQHKGNRSIGRNIAIQNASYNIIAASDAGCTLEKHWLERITLPLQATNKNTEPVTVVSGYYLPVAVSDFQKCLAPYMCVMPDRLNPNDFLPSSRSIAFRKDAWQRSGKYPEDIDTCEDLVFAKKMKKNGEKMVFVADAIVYWPQKDNVIAAFKQFFSYAYGDGQAMYIRSNTPFLFLRYMIGFFLLTIALITNNSLLLTMCYILLALYILWAFMKNIKYCPVVYAAIYLPLLQFTADIAVMSGMTAGVISKRLKS